MSNWSLPNIKGKGYPLNNEDKSKLWVDKVFNYIKGQLYCNKDLSRALGQCPLNFMDEAELFFQNKNNIFESSISYSYYMMFVSVQYSENKAIIGIMKSPSLHTEPDKPSIPVCTFKPDDDIYQELDDENKKKIDEIINTFFTTMKNQNDYIYKTLNNIEKKNLISWEFIE